ncbi:MAG TPA: sulfotransferase [Stellaceae bacterium]|nr:sulfotransferase [Stellaceae bacterium]
MRNRYTNPAMSSNQHEPPEALLARIFAEATALHQRGRLVDAAVRYRAVLAAEPGNFEVLHRLGVLCAQQGDPAEAVELLRRAVACNPDSAPAHNNLGMVLNLMQRNAEAIAPLERAVALDPRNPLAHNNLGVAMQALGRTVQAADAFARAVALRPDYVEALSNLGGALQAQGRREEALRPLEQAEALNPSFAEAQLNLGVVLHGLGRQDEAAACFARAVALAPGNVLAHAQIGLMHLENGRFAEARRVFEEALAIEPDNARIFYNLAQCGAVSADDPHLAEMEKLSENPSSLPDDQRIGLHFGLGKAYADLGRNERSFRHYLDGNALKRRRSIYDEAGDLGLFDRIRAVFSEDLLRKRRNCGNPSDRPVFILGMMRSGSTLVEQVLASHPEVFAAGERPDFNEAYKAVRRTLDTPQSYPEAVPLFADAQLRTLGDAYLDLLEKAAAGSPARRITDKMPGNFSAVGLIRLALPNARIIHTVRDPIDTCLSCFCRLFSENQPFTYDLGELGRYYRAYAELMAYWRRVLPQNSILDVRYEELVDDFETQARRVVAYCGLEWDPACLAFHETDRPVRTASQVQVRQPLYRTAVGRWRPDRETLRPLLEGLGLSTDAADSRAGIIE